MRSIEEIKEKITTIDFFLKYSQPEYIGIFSSAKEALEWALNIENKNNFIDKVITGSIDELKIKLKDNNII